MLAPLIIIGLIVWLFVIVFHLSIWLAIIATIILLALTGDL